MDLQQGLAGRRSPSVRRARRRGPRDAPQAKKDLVVQDPHLWSSAPSNPRESLTSMGEQPECGAQRRRSATARVAVEAQLRDETKLLPARPTDQLQVPGDRK